MVKYEEAIRKPFTDLVRLLTGIVLSFIPIVHWIAKGFAIECSGLGRNKPSAKMPEWKNWLDLFIKGLLSDVISFIYMLPFVAVMLVGVGLTINSLMGVYVGSVISPELMTSVMSKQTSPEVIGNIISQNWMMAVPVLMGMAPLFLIGGILALFAAYVTPIAVLNYIKNEKFSEAFNLNVVLKKTFNIKYTIVWFVAIVLTAILTAILFWIPWIGSRTAFFIASVIFYTLYGQIYREI